MGSTPHPTDVILRPATLFSSTVQKVAKPMDP